MSRLDGFGLYVITPPHAGGCARLERLVAAALAGGARIVQYRDKSDDGRRRLAEATALARLCRAEGALLVVNDDVELAREAGADGVHVGREDTPVAAARASLGAGFMVGATCHDSLQLALAAQRAGADYVAFGSFFPSPTKPRAPPAPLELLGEARAGVDVPIVAIGGVTTANAAALVTAGASFLAVLSAVFDAEDVRASARHFTRIIASAHASRTAGAVDAATRRPA